MADFISMLAGAAGGGAEETDPDFKQTVLLLHGDGTNGAQNNTFLDSSTNNFTITRNGNTTQGTFSPFSVAEGQWSNYFDGTDDYLSVADNAVLRPGAGAFTLEAWVYRNAAGAAHTIYAKGGASTGINFQITSGNVLRFTHTTTNIDSTGTVAANAWVHVAVVREGTGANQTKLYINGTQDGQGTVSTDFTQTEEVRIGTNRSAGDDFAGYISNVRFVKGSALYTGNFTPSTSPFTTTSQGASSSEVELLTCQSNRFVDNSSNAFAITVNGNTSVQPFSPFAPTAAYSASVNGGSGYFDGTGDYLSIASNAAFDLGSGAFTFECFINPAAAVLSRIISRLDTGASAFTFQLGLQADRSIIFQGQWNGSAYSFSLTTAASIVSLNSWAHIAVVRDGANAAIFIDGVRQANSTTISGSFGTAGTINIGRNEFSGGIQYFNGAISSMRVVKGSAVYDPTQTTITVPTTSLTAITNTSLLTCQSNRFVDNSSNAFAITRNGDVRVTPFSPFAPTAAYSASVNGGSGYFDGSSDHLLIAASTGSWADFGTGDFTIEAWIYTPAVSAIQGICGAHTGGLGNTWQFRLNGSTLELFGANSQACASTTAVVANQWVFVTASRSGANAYLGVNGTVNTVAITAGVIGLFSATSGGNVSIGNLYSTPSNYWFTGYISNLRIRKGTAAYTSSFTPPTAPLTAITNTELLCNFTNAGIFDNTGKNNLETVGNAQIDTTTKKYGTGSMEFDGTGDWLIAPNTPDQQLGTGNFTIEFWVYLASGDTGSNRGLVAKGTSTTGFLVSLNTTEKVVFTYATSTITSSGAITTNAWNHIAVVREGTGSNQTKIYIGGTNDGTGTVSTDFNQTSVMYVGANRTGGDPMKGFIDDLRITKGIARYTAAFTPPTKAFPDL